MISFEEMVKFYKKSGQMRADTVSAKAIVKADDKLDVSVKDIGGESVKDIGPGVSKNHDLKDKKKKSGFVTPVRKIDDNVGKNSERAQILEILNENKPKVSRKNKISLVASSCIVTPEALAKPEALATPEAIANPEVMTASSLSLEKIETQMIGTEVVCDLLFTSNDKTSMSTSGFMDGPQITQDNVGVSIVASSGESGPSSKEPFINDGQQKIIECENCKLKFISMTEFDNHQCEVHESEKFFCDLCNIKFKNRKYLKRHVKHKHLKMSHTCKKCLKVFPTEKTLNKHFVRVHVKHECKFCGQILKNGNGLRSHLSHCRIRKETLEHSSDEKVVHTSHAKTGFQCSECKKICKTNQALQGHFNRQHIQQKCQYCDHAFKNKEVLRSHLYKCKVKRRGLDKSPGERLATTDQANLENNNNNNKSNSKSKANTFEKICNLCQKKFHSKGGFYKHRNNVHKGSENNDGGNDVGEVIIIDAETENLPHVDDTFLIIETV